MKSFIRTWVQGNKSVWRRQLAVVLSIAVLATSFQLSVFAEPVYEESGLEAELQALMDQLLQETDTVTRDVYDPEAMNMTVGLAVYGAPEKISVGHGGAPTGDSRASSVSGDGRYVAFVSASSTIVEGDTNGFQDVFLRDRTAGTTKRISLGQNGVQANGHSYAPMISMDGTYVLFSSRASNLVAGDTNSREDLFLYDALTENVQRIAERVPGSEYGGHGSPYQLSADGRFAAYVGVRSPQTGSYDILLKDLHTGKVKLVAAQTYLYDHWRARVSMSADARFLVFESFQRELTLDDYGPYHTNYRDVFLYDIALDEMKRINRSPAGQSANQYSQYPVISANGRYIAYQSLASNLGPSDTNGMLDIYVYDRVAGTTELGSVRSDGSQAAGDAYDASLSGDGRYLSFHTSNAYDEGDTGGLPDVYVRDRVAGVTKRISTAHTGGSPNGESVRATLAADGLSIAFESKATDLLETADGDTFYDIFVMPLEGAGGAAPEWPAETVPAATAGAAYVALSWPEIPGAAYYKVLQDGRLTGITQEPRFAAAGLTPGSSHAYRVAAGSADFRWSAWSGEVAAQTLTEPEKIPPGRGTVTASAQPGLIEAEWQLPDDPDVVGARLIWRVAGQADRQSVLYPKHVTRAAIPNVAGGEYYEVQIAAVDGDGNRSSSFWKSVVTPQGPTILRMDTRMEDGRPAPAAHFSDIRIEDMSEDGRYTVFSSTADDIAVSDANGKADIFLFDRLNGNVQLVSRTPSGAAGNDGSRDGSISADGRYIVFSSASSNFTAEADTNGRNDVFLYDRDTNNNGEFDEEGDVSLTRISTAWDGKQAEGYSFGPDISGDGRKIVFFTGARNLVEQPPQGTDYNVSYDMETRSLEPILLPNGQPLKAQDVQLNHNGSVAVFTAYDSLLPEDEDGSFDIYLYDTAGPKLELVTRRSVLAHSSAGSPSVDDSGRYVAFSITRSTQPYSQVYVYDREAAADARYELISAVRPGAAASLHSQNPDISGDGRYVAFESSEPGLVEGDNDQQQNIFIRDRAEKRTVMASLPYDTSIIPNGSAGGTQISDDGNWIAFRSDAANLVRGSERYRAGAYLQAVNPNASGAAWPAGSSVTVNASGEDFVSLSWTPATGAEAYRIYGTGEPLEVGKDAREKTVSGLDPDTDYLFKVEAMDAGGRWTTNGPSVAFRTPPMADLAELAVTQQGGKAVLLWGDRPGGTNGITGFRIVRKTESGPEQTLATINDPAVRTYTDATAEPGKLHVYAVLALDAGGAAKPYSVQRSITLSRFAIESFAHVLPLYFRKYAAAGETVRLVMRAIDADTARAELEFELRDGSRTTVEAGLSAQTVSDILRGEAAIPENAVRLLQIRGFAERDGELAEASSLTEPIQVGGSVRVALSGSVALPHDATLTISSAGQRANQTARIGQERQFTFVGLPAGDDYKLNLLSSGGINLLEQSGVPPITVTWGSVNEVNAEPRFPASLSVNVTMSHSGVRGGVAVLVSDEEGRPLASGTTQVNGNIEFGAIRGMIGKTAVIRAESPDGRYKPVEIRVPLESGINRHELKLVRETDATLEGHVYQVDGSPLKGAVVTVTQGADNYRATTDEQGAYTLNLPSGQASVQVLADGIYPSANEWKEIEPGKQTYDFTFRTKLPAMVAVNLYTQSGGGAWVGPYQLDWRERVHFRFRVNKPILADKDRIMMVDAVPGETVRICATGAEGDYSDACGEAVIGEDRKGIIELRLRDTAAVISGRLTNLPAETVRYDYTLYEVTEQQYRRTARTASLYAPEFTIKIQGGKNYELVIRTVGGNQSVVRFFGTEAGSRIDLGELPLGESGLLAGKPGNVVWIGGGKPASGGTAHVRATYSNSSGSTLTEAVAVLDVPADTELIPGTVIVNGTAVMPVLQDGRYTVPIGTIGGRKAGSLQYRLRIAAAPAAQTLLLAPSIRYRLNGTVTQETIGEAEADLTPVTLKAPGRVGQRDLTVTGSAPPGSRVTVYEGDLVIGETEASPAGLWGIEAHIPGDGATAVWRLRADARSDSGSWSSTVVSVRYDKGLPEPISFTMRQADGRLMTLDPRGGEAKFPYVFVPGMPFTLTVGFTDPALVDNVAFVFGEERIPASLKDGLYQAVIPGISKGAPIGLDYKEKEPAASIYAPPPPPEEIKRQLPPSFRDVKDDYVFVSPRQDGGTRQTASYRGMMPNAKGAAQIDVSTSMQEMMYTPTQSELDRAEQTGIPVYGFQNSTSFSGGVFRAELTGYLPADRFGQELDAGKAVSGLMAAAERDVFAAAMSGKLPKGKVSALSAGTAVKVVKVSVGLAMRSNAGENTWKTIDAAYSLFDGMGVNDTLAQLEKLMDKVALNCRSDLVPIYMDSIMHLRDRLIQTELIKAGVMVAGAVFGPATFGIGTIALFLASNMYGKLLDGMIGGAIDRLDAEVDEFCRPDKKKPKKPLVDPEWIYDPSGYVYEVTEDNRIEGVKTTVLRWDEAAKRWNVWDAGPYGQMNPLFTDGQGRYAWDVPEGTWKVLYEKEGYLPAESEELVVLPPHFDVNIPMVSTLPAKPIKVSTAPGGESIELLFDRHVRSDAADGGLLSVIRKDSGEAVEGEWQLVEPVTTGGMQASARLRFTPDNPLATDGVYSVSADAALPSYAGVPMGEGYTADVTVNAADTTPPIPVTELLVEADAERALLTWRLPKDPELAKLELRYKEKSAAGDGSTVEIPSGRQFALIEGLSGATDYVFQVRAYDAAGNYSTAEVAAATGSAQGAAADILPPSAIREPSARPGSTQIELVWRDPADPDFTAVNLQWAKHNQPFEGDAVMVQKGEGRYTITGLSPSTAYEIRHWTVDESGNASTTESLFVTTTSGGGGRPTDPTGPTSGAGQQPQKDPDTDSAVLGEGAASVSLFGGKLRLVLPAGGAGSARKLTAVRIGNPVKPADIRLRLLSDAFEWKLDGGGTLAKPGRLMLAYDKAALGSGDPRKLGVYRLDETGGVWRYAGGITDTASGFVELETSLPGVYAVLIAEYSFRDLTTHWGRADIEALAARGIVTGDLGGTFRPNGKVTRAEFVKLLASLIDAEPATGTAPFNDVPQDAWYASAVTKAHAAGVIMGSGGKFRPNDSVTRQEMAVMLYRASLPGGNDGPDEPAALDGFKDGGEVSPWARQAVAYEVQSGTLRGSGGLLKPAATATRAEAAAVLIRKLDGLGLLVKR